MASNEVDFQALYQSSLKLTTAIDDFGIPRLEKTLAQLDDASRAPPATSKLVLDSGRKPRAVVSKASVDKANFLLAAKGIDAEKLSKELQAFEIAPGFEAEMPLSETDIDGYLTRHHEMIILTAIDDVNRRTTANTHDRMNQAMIDDFERAKLRFLEDLGSSKQLGVRNYPRILETLQENNVFAASQQEQAGRGFNASVVAPSSRLDMTKSGVFFTGGSSAVPSASSFGGAPSRLDMTKSGVFFTMDGSATRRFDGVGSLNLSHLGAESQMTEEMKFYHSVIHELTASHVPNTRGQFDLVGAFQRVCTEQAAAAEVGSKWEAVLKCWQVLGNMLAGGDLKDSTRSIAEREFASLHEQDSAQRLLTQQRFAYGARVFLETQFRAFVQQTVQQQHLAIGGVPDLVANVRAFVKHLQIASFAAGRGASSDGDVDIWSLLYYCLRCGGDNEAIALATSSLRAGDSALDEDVLCGLRYRAQQKQAADSLRPNGSGTFSTQFAVEYGRLIDRYSRLTSASVDAVSVVNPFERSVINLLCFGNANASEPQVLTTIEDYLWQRLCFIQRSSATTQVSPDSVYTISRLSKSIQIFGPSHFENPSDASIASSYAPFLYFEILLITQEFEQAIKYIGSRGFLLEAVHFSIALNYYGLLRCTISGMEEEDDMTVNFVRVVRQYVHAFQRTNAAEAAEYIGCVSDLPAKKELFAELLLDTRKFDMLAGFTDNTDGSRTRGLLDRLLSDSSEDEVRELILSAARKADAYGRPVDAYALLKCAGDMEGIIAVLNTQLSSTLTASRPEREEWFAVAKDFAEKWMRFPWVQAIANRNARTAAVAFQTLLNISMFLEVFEHGQFEDAIRFVDGLEIIPTPEANNLPVCVDRFLSFEDCVRQNFHVLLLAYMECLVREAERCKTQAVGDARRVNINALREKAELVVTFAGMIKFRLPSGTNERLNRMEAMIF